MDLSPHVGEIARRLLGPENRRQSTGSQLRFGNNGSIAVEIAGERAGQWFDHEHNEGGGPFELIHAKLGLADGAAMDWLSSELGIAKRRIETTYDYRDEDGKLLFQVVRFDPKDFRQRRTDGTGGWKWSTKGTRMVPYRLPELLAAIAAGETVYIAEGEKAVEALRGAGLAATCSPRGAGKWREEYADFFAGADVVVLPDNDGAGTAHADQVVRSLVITAHRVSILDLAKHEPRLPPKGDAHDWFALGRSAEDLRWLLDGVEPLAGTAAASPSGLDLVHFDQMRARLTDGYLIKHLLASGSMAVVYGESGTGKTFFALDLGLGIAAGTKFFGRRVRRAGVVYVAAEAGRGIENRVEAYKREIGAPEGMPFAAIVSPINLCAEDGDIDALISAVRAAALVLPVELIVIDTLSRVMAGGNENQPDDMGAFVRNIDRLRAETGAAVVIVHHSGKDASRGARGHSLLRAATDTEIEVTRDEAAKVPTARVTKQREYATEGSLSFTLKTVELGVDRDGDPVGSCVVEPTEFVAPAKSAMRPLSHAQGRALQLLAEAIDKGGEVPPANNHIPPGFRCVPEATWREYCYRGGVQPANAGLRSKGSNEPQRRSSRPAGSANGNHGSGWHERTKRTRANNVRTCDPVHWAEGMRTNTNNTL